MAAATPGASARPYRTPARSAATSPGEAATAGYRPVPLPAGTLVIGGTYLVPTGRAFRARCQLAADRLGFAVPAQGPAADLGARHGTPELCGREAPCDHGQ